MLIIHALKYKTRKNELNRNYLNKTTSVIFLYFTVQFMGQTEIRYARLTLNRYNIIFCLFFVNPCLEVEVLCMFLCFY